MRKLFERQLAKATGPSGELDINLLANLVTSAYDEAEQDRQRTDRAISLMIEEVHQTNARLLDAFTIVPEGLVLLNAEGKYVLYNQRFVELYDPMRDTIRSAPIFPIQFARLYAEITIQTPQERKGHGSRNGYPARGRNTTAPNSASAEIDGCALTNDAPLTAEASEFTSISPT